MYGNIVKFEVGYILLLLVCVWVGGEAFYDRGSARSF